jgi:hypothetical protein
MSEILFFYCSFIAKILNLESYTYIEYDQKNMCDFLNFLCTLLVHMHGIYIKYICMYTQYTLSYMNNLSMLILVYLCIIICSCNIKNSHL